jgi:carboxyl-terminal processing protease
VKLFKSLLAAAMGFFLGIVLAGAGGLSAEAFMSAGSKSESSKKLENYWSETGLSRADAEIMISNAKCASSKLYYRGCLSALIQNALSLKLKLSEKTGRLESVTDTSPYEEMTEADLIAHYSHLKNSPDFEQSLRVLFSKTEEPREAMLAAQLINSFMSVYMDPHTYILPEQYYSQVHSKIERSKFFVGLSYERKSGELLIKKIIRNSDADLAGLKPFDKLLAINGKRTAELTYSAISSILRDEKASEFTFEIERSGSPQKIRLKRSYRTVSNVQYNDLNAEKRTGLLTLTKFSKGVCSEVQNILREKKPEALVVDLRDNPGGQLSEVACLAGVFLGKDKKAYYIEYLDVTAPNELVLTTEDLAFSGPVGVLVNSRSASASETLAGALKEYKRAVIIGRRTFGKGTFQEPEPWVLNPQISLFKTQGRYLLPSRNSTQAVGVKPDVELAQEPDEKREKDIYFRPLPSADEKYPPLRAGELVKKFDYEKCSHDLKLKKEGDIYLSTAQQVLDCTTGRGSMLAQAGQSQSLN